MPVSILFFFLKSVFSKRKEFASLVGTFFPLLGLTPFKKEIGVQESRKGGNKDRLPCKNIAKNLPSRPMELFTQNNTWEHIIGIHEFGDCLI